MTIRYEIKNIKFVEISRWAHGTQFFLRHALSLEQT